MVEWSSGRAAADAAGGARRLVGLGRCIVAMEARCGGASSRPDFLGAGSRAAADAAGICSPVREVKQERHPRRRSDRGSGEPADDAVCRSQEQKQSDVQALHRARERLVNERTGLINHLRALLLERGIVTLQGRRKLEAILETLGDEGGG